VQTIEKNHIIIDSLIFIPAFPLRSVAGAAALGGLEAPHSQACASSPAGPALAGAGPNAKPRQGPL